MGKTVLILCFFISFCHLGTSLKCYTCSVWGQDEDQACIDHPEETTITDCNKKFCTIIIQEDKAEGNTESMYRGCADQPLYVDQIVEDQTYRYYYSACEEPLCNGGSGKWKF